LVHPPRRPDRPRPHRRAVTLIPYLRARVIQAAFVILAAATLTFALVRVAPGNACGDLGEVRFSDAARRHCVARLHLDQPLAAQYVQWLADITRGDFGESFATGEPVAARIAHALPNTVLLMTLAVSASFLIGIGLAVFETLRPRSRLAQLANALALACYALPDFWLAQLALLAFAYLIPIFPPGGVSSFGAQYGSVASRFGDRLAHLVLPVLTLAALSTAAVLYFQRVALRGVRHEDWIRTARAKGVGERGVVLHHTLRNALVPTITLFGAQLPAIAGGAVFVEKVFAWPGLGSLAVDAVSARDYPVVVGCVTIGAAAVAIGSLLADCLHALVDPRVRDTLTP
jgi:peptide/nickel transport system permease protein